MTTRGTESLAASCVINCTGSATDYRRVESPLLRMLFLEGYAVAGDMEATLVTNAHGALEGRIWCLFARAVRDRADAGGDPVRNDGDSRDSAAGSRSDTASDRDVLVSGVVVQVAPAEIGYERVDNEIVSCDI